VWFCQIGNFAGGRGFEFFSGMTRAKDIIVIDYDVADVNADAKLYPLSNGTGAFFSTMPHWTSRAHRALKNVVCYEQRDDDRHDQLNVRTMSKVAAVTAETL